MPFNGSGTYSLPAGNPVVTGTTISSTTTNNTNSDIATALTNCLTRDGQSTPSANLPMNSKKLTGLAAGTTAGDSVRYEQIQYVEGVSSAGTSGYVLTSNGAGTAPSFQSLSVVGFLPTTGGTMTGAITFAAGQTFTGTLPLTGGTMTGLLTTKELALTKTAPSISAGVLTLDCSLSNTFAVSLNAAITSFTVSNIPTSGSYYEFNLEFTADGTARSVTWTFSSVAVKWPGGTAPTLTSTNGKKDTFVFYTYDAGTTWLGFVAGQNL